MASTRPAWASEMTSWTPDRPRAIRERRKASQPAPVLGGGDVQAEDLAVTVGVDADRDQCVDVDDPAAFADLLGERIDPDERVRAGVQGPVAEGCDLIVQVLGHRADLGLGQLGDAEGLGELLDSAGGDPEQVGGGDHRDQGLFGPATSFQQPVREVAALPQLGDGELDGPGAGVPLARAIAVAMVDSFLADLPVFGVAEGVGFRRHERVGERLDHRAQQVRTRRGEIVFREGVQGQTVGCGHRAYLLQGLGRLERSAGGRSHIRTLTPTPGQTPGSGGSPYTTSQDATAGNDFSVNYLVQMREQAGELERAEELALLAARQETPCAGRARGPAEGGRGPPAGGEALQVAR